MSATRPHKPYVVTTERIQYWFSRLNRKVFNTEVPLPRSIIIVEKSNAWGYCYTSDVRHEPRWWDLQLISYFPSFKTFLECLAHEMVHAHNYWHNTDDFWKVPQGHGKLFFAWKPALQKVGIHLTIKAYEPDQSLSDSSKFSKLAVCRNIKVPSSS